MTLSSKLVEDAVSAFATLPGVGKKSALRHVLHLIGQERETTEAFAEAILKMRRNLKTCRSCHNISDNDLCTVCTDQRRDRSTVMVVEGLRDLMAVEDTSQYKGLYHILGGVISPIEGISPSDLNIESLMERLTKSEIKEVIMAISPTIEGETTIYYLSKRLSLHEVKISTLARGIAFGGELEYADEVTLGRSIAARIPYHQREI